MKFTKCDVSAMITESREACKSLRKLRMLRKTVATHRLKELRHLRAVEKLKTWRRSNGSDRYDARDGQWIHSSLPPTPEETTASMWVDVNALKKAILMSGKVRSKQRVESFLDELEQETASLTDKDFARLERMIVERRDRAAANVVVAPIDTSQPCNPRSRYPEISFDVHVCIEKNTEVEMDPEPGELEQSSVGTDQLKSPSAGTCFETPEQQCLLNWEMGRTTVDGCLLASVSSNLGGNTFSLTELVIGTRTDSQTSTPSASSKIVFLQVSRKPGDSEPASEENK